MANETPPADRPVVDELTAKVVQLEQQPLSKDQVAAIAQAVATHP